jgi:hypothetical protein
MISPWSVVAALAGAAAGVGAAHAYTRTREGELLPPVLLPDVLGDFEYELVGGARPAVIVAIPGALDAGTTAGMLASTGIATVAPIHNLAPESAVDQAAELVAFVEELRQHWPGRIIIAGDGPGADVAFALAAELTPGIADIVVGAGGRLPDEPIRTRTVVVHGRDATRVPYPDVINRVTDGVAGDEPIDLVPLSNVGDSLAGALRLRWLEEVSRASA